MVFNFDSRRWSRDCKNRMKSTGQSYRDLQINLPMSHSTIQRIFEMKIDVTMKQFILISANLKLDAINYFDVDEVQQEMF